MADGLQGSLSADYLHIWDVLLHIWDVLETAGYAGLRLRPKVKDAPSVKIEPLAVAAPPSFEVMIAEWFPLTYVINNLTRGLGQPDGYPFVLSVSAVKKLRFVHDTIADYISKPPQARTTSKTAGVGTVSNSPSNSPPPLSSPPPANAGSAPARR